MLHRRLCFISFLCWALYEAQFFSLYRWRHTLNVGHLLNLSRSLQKDRATWGNGHSQLTEIFKNLCFRLICISFPKRNLDYLNIGFENVYKTQNFRTFLNSGMKDSPWSKTRLDLGGPRLQVVIWHIGRNIIHFSWSVPKNIRRIAEEKNYTFLKSQKTLLFTAFLTRRPTRKTCHRKNLAIFSSFFQKAPTKNVKRYTIFRLHGFHCVFKFQRIAAETFLFWTNYRWKLSFW